MAAWQLNESRGLGGSEKVWTLSKDGDGLTIGRATYCDIQILSQSVEKKHSLIKWDQKKEGYVLHDLGSVNGTFLNERPLHNGIATLQPEDTLRFGYDKGHLFRVKKVEQPPLLPPHAPPHSQPTPSSLPSYPHSHTLLSTSSQQVSGVHYVPIQSMSPSLILPAAIHPYLLPQPIYSPHVPQMSCHMTGHVTTPSPHAIGYTSPYGSVISPSPVPTTPLHLLTYPQTPTPLPRNQPSTSTQLSFSPSDQVSSTTKSKREGSSRKQESVTSSTVGNDGHSRPVTSRKDGRRSISLSSADMPRLSEVSSLYGRPSWWGEEEKDVKRGGDDSSSSSPRKPPKHEPQILRDISPSQIDTMPHSTTQPQSITTSSHSASHAKGLDGDNNNFIAGSESPSLAWTFEAAGPRRSRALPAKWQRPIRSADSSPIRRRHTEKQHRSVSPNTPPATNNKNPPTSNNNNRYFTPLSRRITAQRPPSDSRTSTSGKKTRAMSASQPQVQRRKSKDSSREQNKQERLLVVKQSTVQQQTPSKQTPSKQTPSKQTPSKQTPSKQTPSKQTPSKQTPSTVQRDDNIQTPGTNSSPLLHHHREDSEGLRSQSETVMTSRKKKAEETFVVTSPPSDDERPNSAARKQWSNEPQQNSLMMASIEARMRRLEKLAQTTYLNLTAVEENIGASQMVSTANSASSPLPNVETVSYLPEWKFFNKEVDSIFKSIRSVEKWLKDIDTTVVANLRLHGKKQEDEDGEGRERDDQNWEPRNVSRVKEKEKRLLNVPGTSFSSSEGGEFHDSIEDLQCTTAGNSD